MIGLSCGGGNTRVHFFFFSFAHFVLCVALVSLLAFFRSHVMNVFLSYGYLFAVRQAETKHSEFHLVPKFCSDQD